MKMKIEAHKYAALATGNLVSDEVSRRADAWNDRIAVMPGDQVKALFDQTGRRVPAKGNTLSDMREALRQEHPDDLDNYAKALTANDGQADRRGVVSAGACWAVVECRPAMGVVAALMFRGEQVGRVSWSTGRGGLFCVEIAGAKPQEFNSKAEALRAASDALAARADVYKKGETAPTVITAPGDYVTRNGTRVTIDSIDNGSVPYTFPCKGSAWKMFRGVMRPRGYNVWMRSGHLHAVGDHPLDIVGPWEDLKP